MKKEEYEKKSLKKLVAIRQNIINDIKKYEMQMIFKNEYDKKNKCIINNQDEQIELRNKWIADNESLKIITDLIIEKGS